MTAGQPATYGGAGWRPRGGSHREDVAGGRLWHRCGVASEVAPLEEVMLAWPDGLLPGGGEPNDSLFLEWPDPERLRFQAVALHDFYESQGVRVRWAKATSAMPNYLFQRDLFFMTPEGAVLARPGSDQRAGEARCAALALAGLGVPILATPRGDGLFEGADALWLDRRTVLIGIGLRTNDAGAACVGRLLRDMGIDAIPIHLPLGVQHLLGVVNFIDRNLAAVRIAKASGALLDRLRAASVEIIHCDEGVETTGRFAMNFVTLAPRQIVIPAGCPSFRQRLIDAGVRVYEMDVSEYGKGAGGLGCLTGILARRDAA
ncbi:dimethylarginine dimethylaminohydrolase family protein [Azospirillum sp. B506]|uniref:dimethylarginine dimethylaminohydrolase family protein n=1 Tax=Azospirillum sp. B506 TaxID=137721 RepID=UPI0003449BA5|nr:arginine deiminase family protein [Azospirillum sp. B506]